MASSSQADSDKQPGRLSRRTLVTRAGIVAAAVPLAAVSGRLGPFGANRVAHADEASEIRFTLVPSSLKPLFPNATGTVTIIPGTTADDVYITVRHMPPNTTFTCYLIENINKPFGSCQYIVDVITDNHGFGDDHFRGITLQAYAMIAEAAGTSQDQSGLASGTQLEHFGMWFSSIDDARRILRNPALKGTPFDGGAPPNHAGPQAMNDGSLTPVF